MQGVALLAALLLQDSLYARAASLLASGDLPAARAVAERIVAIHGRDPRAHLLLGQIWSVWPVVGRYSALAEFRTAERLTQQDPEPLYWQVRVGQVLRGDEGEAIVREALLKIFSLKPDYRDCWALFERLYHNEDTWRRADQALARHGDDIMALEHRAQIAIALEEPARADSLAALVLATRAAYVPAYLLRAEAAFDASRDSAGYAWYARAVANAEGDSTGAMWDVVWMIASPEETARLRATSPGDRPAYFQWFWERRDPNLVTRENERIAEHFRRLGYVRRMFHLLHPLATTHHSSLARTLQAYADRVFQDELVDSSPEVLIQTADLAHTGDRERGSADDLQFRSGFDGRGLLWIRHGRPDVRLAGVLDPIHGVPGGPLDESWIYSMPWGEVVLSFGSPGGGEMRWLPFTARQVEGQRRLLATDRTALPASLATRSWSAFFRSESHGNTDLYVRTSPESAAVVLWEAATGTEVARASGSGLLRVSTPPGSYDMGLDVDSGGAVGRLRQSVQVPGFAWAVLRLSSLILTPGDSLKDRETALSGMPASLLYAGDRPLLAYAEVYGLSRDARDRVRYRVRYTFAPMRPPARQLLGAPTPVTFEFDRESDWRTSIPERLVIEPERLPRGRYRVTLAVTDLLSNVKSETVALEISVR